MDRDSENTKLFEKILAAIKEGNAKLDTVNSKLDQIIQNTAAKPSDEITNLGGKISTPTKQ